MITYFLQLIPQTTSYYLYEIYFFTLQESGPTFVGDEWSDPKLMEYLGASRIKALGNNL